MITLTQDSSKTKPLGLPCPCCSLSPCPSLVVSGPTVELLCNAKSEIGEVKRSRNRETLDLEKRTGENVVSVVSVVSGGWSECRECSEWWV